MSQQQYDEYGVLIRPRPSQQQVQTVDDYGVPIKKKVSGGTSSTTSDIVATPSESPSNLPSGLQEGSSVFPTKENPLPFLETPKTVTTFDGTPLAISPTDKSPYANTLRQSPIALNQLQQRVLSKTTTPLDLEVLSSGSNKSIAATHAYITKGKDVGTATDINDNTQSTEQFLKNSISGLSKEMGAVNNPDEIANNPDEGASFLSKLHTAIKATQGMSGYLQGVVPFVKSAYDVAENLLSGKVDKNKLATDVQQLSENAGTKVEDKQKAFVAQAQKALPVLVQNITDQTAKEAFDKGIEDSQAIDLLYKRLDPESYEKSVEMRNATPQSASTKVGTSILNGVAAIKNFSDWVTNADENNKELLNAEKGQYELLLNRGLGNYAAQLKAKGISTGDQQLIEQANTLIPKIQDESAIVEKYPMLIKQQMADYINQRYAEETGILNGTEVQGANGRLLKYGGVNTDAAKRYLREGGFYDKPNFKDYADDVAEHPATYLATGNTVAGAPMQFLNVFKSIFNSVADLEGFRTAEDRHAENIKSQMFPSELTENIKPDISFDLGGHHFETTVAKTLNGVAHLGGYMATAALGSAIGGAAGLSGSAAARVGAWSSFGADAIDSGLKTADQLNLTPAQSWLYAGMNAVMMAEGGRLLEFGKATPVPQIAGVNQKIADAAIGLTNKTLTEGAAKELVDGAVNTWAGALKKWGIGTAKGAGVMTAFGVGDKMLRVAAGDPNANLNDILPEAANAYFDGLLTMGVIGGFGLPADIAKAKNSTYKAALSSIVDNHDAAKDILQIGLDRGLFSKQEYDQKVAVLNTGLKAKASLNGAIAKTGVSIDGKQRQTWIANATAEKVLRDQAEKEGVSQEEAAQYIKQADALKEQNGKIFNGLKFSKLLEPQYNLYDAQQALNEAQKVYAETPTPENEQSVIDKKAIFDKFNENYLNGIPENKTNEAAQAENTVPVSTEKTGTTNEAVDNVSKEAEAGTFEDKVRELYPALKNTDDAGVNDFIKENATDTPSKFINDFGQDKFNEVVKSIPTKELQNKLDIILDNNSDSKDVDILDKLISDRESEPQAEQQSVANSAGGSKPDWEQQLKDIQEGNIVTFTYDKESDVPEVFKDKISSTGETNGKKFVRVTVAKSLADYELNRNTDKENKPVISKEQQPIVNSNSEDFRNSISHLLVEPNKGRADLLIGNEDKVNSIKDAFTYTTRGTNKKEYKIDVDVYESKNGKRYIARDKDGTILSSAFVDNDNKLTGIITDRGFENVGIGTNLYREVLKDNPKVKASGVVSKQGQKLLERVQPQKINSETENKPTISKEQSKPVVEYRNKKSILDGQKYEISNISERGTVTLTPIEGKTKKEVKISKSDFDKASKQGFYSEVKKQPKEVEGVSSNSNEEVVPSEKDFEHNYKSIADITENTFAKRDALLQEAILADDAVNKPTLERINAIDKEISKMMQDNGATSDRDLMRKVATENVSDFRKLVELQSEREDLYKNVKRDNVKKYNNDTDKLIAQKIKPFQDAIKKEEERIDKGITDLSTELGATRNDLKWGTKEIDEDLGDRIGDNKSAIFIKPHETEIDTTNGTESVVDGLQIELVTVNPKNRGEGLAKKRLKQITDEADKRNLPLFIDAVPQEKGIAESGLIKLYEQYGFKFDGIHGKREPKPINEPANKVENNSKNKQTEVPKPSPQSPLPTKEEISKYSAKDKLALVNAVRNKDAKAIQEITERNRGGNTKLDKGDYRLQHRINDDIESTSSLDNLTKSGNGENLVPEDLYSHPEYYADMKDKAYKESWEAIKKAKGNPDAEVTIYRSVPKGVKKINEGDWVSLSPTYAKQEGLHPTDESKDNPVISKKVKVKDVRWDGNDINEFGYFPSGREKFDKSSERNITMPDGSEVKVKPVNADVVNGFYSPLEKTINETKFDKLPAKQWIDKFAKGEEAKWTGLSDWLAQQQGSVSKADIQKYLKDNRIQIVEVVKDNNEPTPNRITNNGEFDYSNQTKFSDYQLKGQKENYKEILVTMPDNSSERFQGSLDNFKQSMRDKYGDGWKNKMTDKEANTFDSIVSGEDKSTPKFKSSHFSEPNILVHVRMNTRTDAEGKKTLFLEEIQSDWNQSGRKKGFTATSLDKNRFQVKRSDRGDFVVIDKNAIGTYKEDYAFGETEKEATETALKKYNMYESGNVPNGPFVSDTNSTTKLALKVALKEAVKEGADKIAWTTGEQQNDRYDLSQQVKNIDYQKNNDGTYWVTAIGKKNDHVLLNDKNMPIKRIEDTLGKGIAGKILEGEGEKFFSGGKLTHTSITGENLKVSGTGMKGFYGSPEEGKLGIVGNVAKSLFKQEPKTTVLKGTKEGFPYNEGNTTVTDMGGNSTFNLRDKKGDVLATITRKTANEYPPSMIHGKLLDLARQSPELRMQGTSTQHSIDITPELRAQVEQGQSLFDKSKGQIKTDEGTMPVEQYVSRAKAVLEKLFPKAKFEAYDTTADYLDAGGTYGTNGLSRLKGNGDRVIMLDMQRIRENGTGKTAFHEVIHPIVDEVVGDHPEEINPLWNQISEQMRHVDGFGDVLLHVGNYKEHEHPASEGITELLTQIVEGNISLDAVPPARKGVIIDLLNKLFEKLGLNIRFGDSYDFKSFATDIKKAFETGDTESLKQVVDKKSEENQRAKDNASKISKLLFGSDKADKSETDINDVVKQLRELGLTDKEIEEGLKQSGDSEADIKRALGGGGKSGNVGETEGLGQGDGNAITHAAIDDFRREMGFEPFSHIRMTDAEVNAKADKAIADGYDVQNLFHDIAKGHNPNEVEVVILKKTKAAIDAAVEKNPSKANLKKAADFATASDVAGQIAGRAFRLRQDIDEVDVGKQSLSDFFVTRMRNKGVTPETMTDAQKSEIQKQYKDLKDAHDKLEAKVAKLVEADAKRKAESAVKKMKDRTSSQPKKTHEEYVKERKSLVEQLKAAKAKAEESMKGITKSGFSVTVTPEMVRIIGKIAYSHVSEGAQKLQEVSQKVYNEIKDVFEGVTQQDVIDVLAGAYNAVKPEKNDILKRMAALRSEAIKESAIAKEKKDAQRLKTIKKTYQRKIDKLKEDLRTGKYLLPKDVPEPLKYDQEALDLKDQYISIKQETQRLIAKDEYIKKSSADRFWINSAEALNIMRTIMSSSDFSAVLRQAVVPTIAHPLIAVKSMGGMFRDAFSQKLFDRWLFDLKESPVYDEMVRSKVYISDPNDVRLSKKEEAFMNNFVEKVPVIGSWLVKGSERAYLSYLNRMRVELYQLGSDVMARNGKTIENSPKDFEGLGSFVNNMTGRGGVPESMELATPLISAGIFAPRLIASRLNLLGITDIPNLLTRTATLGNKGVNMGFYSKLPPEIRRMAITDMAKFIMFGSAVLGLASLFGNDDKNKTVEFDPRSSDFGKIKVGDTRYDMWGGMQQYVVFFSRMIKNETKSVNGKMYDLDGKGAFGRTRADVIESFVRGKSSPALGMGWDFVKGGRTIVGDKILYGNLNPFGDHKRKEITGGAYFAEHFLPMTSGDITDALESGDMRNLFAIPATIFGISVQTFNDKK